MAKRVLVTGGAGYIGSHAVWMMRDLGMHVTVLDNLSTGVRENLPQDVTFFEGDIGDSVAVKDILKSQKVDSILHFAGSVVVPESVSDPLSYYHNNTVNSHTLIAAACDCGVQSFIFSSTAAVYGIPEQTSVSEDTPLNPINPYGASKMMTERMLLDTASASDIRVGILRYFNVAGADLEGRTGQSTPFATHLIKVACQTALGHRPEMSIFGTDYPTPDGTGVRDYIHVSDLILAHILLLNHLDKNNGPFVFNCGYGQGSSVREIVDTVRRVSGSNFDAKPVDRRAGDPPALIASSNKIKAELGWEPQHDSLETIVKSALAWESRETG